MKIFTIILIFILGLISGIILDKTTAPARAEVAGMDSYDLRYDYDFKRAVQSIVEDCTVDGEDISC